MLGYTSIVKLCIPSVANVDLLKSVYSSPSSSILPPGARRDGGGYLSAGRSGGASAEETRSGHKAVVGGKDEVDGRTNTLFSKLSTHAFIVMFDINSMPSYRHAQVHTNIGL